MNCLPCGCFTGVWLGAMPPPRCAFHSGASYGHVTFTPVPVMVPPGRTLTDADVEAIAEALSRKAGKP